MLAKVLPSPEPDVSRQNSQAGAGPAGLESLLIELDEARGADITG
jgi:hypothetical protein